MLSINEKAIDLMKSLQNYINDVENGKPIERDDLRYSIEVETVLGRFINMRNTSKMPCFNGKYDIDQDSFDYYVKELAKKYNLKLIKDEYFPNDWIISDGHKKHNCFLSIVESSHKIDGVNTNHLDIDFINYSVVRIAYSFYELDRIFSEIESGDIFKEFDNY